MGERGVMLRKGEGGQDDDELTVGGIKGERVGLDMREKKGVRVRCSTNDTRKIKRWLYRILY